MEKNRAFGKRVLLVDDDLEFRELVKTALEMDCCTVVEANNGAEAFGLYRRQAYDVVMLDLNLPFVSGDELAVQIKRLSPEQPIMLLTGYTAKAGPRCPVDAVLRKPVDLTKVRQTMASLIPESEADPEPGPGAPAQEATLAA